MLNEQFKTQELLKVLRAAGLDFDMPTLKAWHRRGVLPAEPVGSGRDRLYTFADLAYIAALAFLSPHMRYGGMDEAKEHARGLAESMLCALRANPKPDDEQAFQIAYENGRAIVKPVPYAQLFRTTAINCTFRVGIPVHPAAMAYELHFRASEVIKQRTAEK